MLPVRPGAVYGVENAQIALQLIAEQQSKGNWAAIIGLPEIGFAAAQYAGMDMSRTLVVPDPGARWAEVLATFIDSVGVIAIRPPVVVRDYEAARIAARLRKRKVVLLSFGPWPRMEARFSFEHHAWLGIGNGHGFLQAREGIIKVHHRSGQVAKAG